ncbi:MULTISPECIES: hypothetical protein [Gammaproteobacteria]|jgi:hypothetical protein|uniref:Secreted protein n=4 Tax=Pseudomonas TaxID=286 RepID=A0AAP7KDR5_9PSED|nr:MULTISPECIES: hypothetical protein [Gammaproteobacteria]HCG0849549.1 hypothetical protein [Pseudomonas aeruginosa]AIN58482.1 hypothetical protein O165_009330 [Pseudomonas soli]ANC81748.1 hypothetical protein KKK_12265 [Pseudomonas putida B6-2]APO82494.1 hypothetical protein BL240_13955 [Pseudomonas putida]MBA6092651.1 hypothetical protein [Pseudomonas monteilii]
MRLTNLFLIGVMAVGISGQAFAEGGAERSLKFNKEFRDDQKRLWGEKEKEAEQSKPSSTQQKEGPKSQS